ncbi:MAG: peptidoglycan DD-metalloendopeptidase family protein [Myxococcota bacterium]
MGLGHVLDDFVRLCVCVGICAAVALASFDAGATDFRRPFEEAVGPNYGYDNNYGDSGCTDYNCGSRCYDGHSGTDFPLVVGTKVVAVADGTVTATNDGCDNYGGLGNTCGGRCGNYIKIQHADGDHSLYCHMKKGAHRVSRGDTVSCGQVIGETASSGSSTGPHLHLGWERAGGDRPDAYRGQCTNSPGTWREQRGYDSYPSAECGCVPSTEVCDGVDNDCDGEVDEGNACAVDLLVQAPHAYTTPHSSDVDGDGDQDLCARFYGGYRCYESTSSDWGGAIIDSSLFAEEGGWGAPEYYATIRMGDVDGDGRADVCARAAAGFRCWRSTGTSFEPFGGIDAWSDANGGTDPRFYTTIRLIDIDGDGDDDVCAREPQGVACYPAENDGFGDRIDGPNWSDESGFDDVKYFGTIRTGDVNGDGRGDLCVRAAAGLNCYVSESSGFRRLDTDATFSNENGWGSMVYFSSIRLADIDGDGMDDACGRDADELFCNLATGSGFVQRISLAGLSDAQGWDDRTNYQTLRVGDITGDGADELCIRANAGMRCYGWSGSEATRIEGPGWSDENSWDAAHHHQPLFLSDITGDGLADMCARESGGLTCRRSTGSGFDGFPTFQELTNDGGWTDRKYYSTIRLGRGAVDDDEDDCAASGGCDAGGGSDAGGDGDTGAQSDAGDADDAGGDVTVDGSGSDDATDDGGTRIETSSSCSTTPAGALDLSWALLALLFVVTGPRGRSRYTMLVIFLAACAVGCDSPKTSGAEARATAPAEEASETGGAPGPSADEDQRKRVVLSVAGEHTLVGLQEPAPDRSDGPARYALVLEDAEGRESLHRGRSVTDAVFLSGGRYLFADVSGGLWHAAIGEDATRVAGDVTSALATSLDGEYATYIERAGGEQRLVVLDAAGSEVHSLMLGESMAWSPVISPDATRVAWASSPRGFPELIEYDFDEDKRRSVVNEGADVDIDALEPTPTGSIVWGDDGIVFESRGTLYRLADGGAPAAIERGGRLVVDVEDGEVESQP